VRADSTCFALSVADSAKITSLSLSGGCTPSGGLATGGVQTRRATELCCER
jgi:hypothetical protein